MVTGTPGREHLLAIITDNPLGLNWMPQDPNTLARVLNQTDIDMLIAKLRVLEGDFWSALSSYFEIVA